MFSFSAPQRVHPRHTRGQGVELAGGGDGTRGEQASREHSTTQHVCKYSNESYDSIRNIPKVRLDESRMKAADIERRREMWEAHAFEEFISDLISPDR